MKVMKTSGGCFMVCAALMLLWTARAFGAEVYPPGPGALEVFNGEGFAVTPLWVKIWLAIMISTFVVGLIFVRSKPLARWVVGGFILSLVTVEVVFSALGLPLLGGAIAIWHIVCWTPGLFMLLMQRPFLNGNEGLWYRVWSGAITCVILFSFFFDIRDAAIYINHLSGLAR